MTDEVCPCCGDFADLDEMTGWCAECSGHKPCVRCGTWRPLTEYRLDPRTSDGRRGACSPCLRIVERERRLANLEERRERERQKTRRYRALTRSTPTNQAVQQTV